jgi:hypothetical protein
MAGRDASSPRLRHPPRLIKSERRMPKGRVVRERHPRQESVLELHFED